VNKATRIGEASMSAMVLTPYSQSSDQQQQQPKSAELISSNLTPSTHVTKSPPKTKRTFKVIIIGDANVGKTCLSFRFCNGRFPVKTEATIGVDFRERSITIDGELLKIQLWDTAGQERFRQSMIAHYYRNVHAVVFVYDMTKSATFRNIARWIDECKAHSVSNVPMVLVGNKCDMNEQVQINVNEAQKFADHNDMPLFETSAKSDSEQDHVEAIFMTLVHKLKDSKEIHVQSEEEREHKNNVDLETEAMKQSSSGCSRC
jgi:Ras-related protein Rab-33B